MLELFYFILILCGYYTAYVISLYSLAVYIDPDEIENLYPKISKNRKEFLTKLASDPRAFVQIAIVYKSFVLIFISFAVIEIFHWLSVFVPISSGVLTPIGLLFSWLLYIFSIEYLPRITSREAISFNMLKRLWLILIIYRIFMPVIIIYRNALKRSGSSIKVSEEEKDEIVERAIETLADEAGIGEKLVEDEEKEMIGQIFQLDQTIVKEIMIPRIDITGFEKSMTFKDIREIVLKDGHSRYPVYNESIDKIIGLVYVKDIFNKLPEPGEEFQIEQYIRKPFFVPESKIINKLLKEFRAKRLHIAIVMDEYGGVAGLVTLEDIIEEIVGDIQDEHDWEEADFSKLADGRFKVDAGIQVEELQEFFDTDFEQEESETVGGLIYDLVGSVPEEKLKIKWNAYEFEIESVKGQRILYVKVKKLG